MAEGVGFEPTYRLLTDNSISSRARYGASLPLRVVWRSRAGQIATAESEKPSSVLSRERQRRAGFFRRIPDAVRRGCTASEAGCMLMASVRLRRRTPRPRPHDYFLSSTAMTSRASACRGSACRARRAVSSAWARRCHSKYIFAILPKVEGWPPKVRRMAL